MLQAAYSRRRRRTGPTREPTCTRTSRPLRRRTRWAITITIRARVRPSVTTRAFHRIWRATRTTRHHDRRPTCTGPPGRCPVEVAAVVPWPRSGQRPRTNPSIERERNGAAPSTPAPPAAPPSPPLAIATTCDVMFKS